MKILIAPDKFKGSITAQEVCKALAHNISSKQANTEVTLQALADGGDGTLEILKSTSHYDSIEVKTSDPLNRSISTNYLSNGHTAFIELAQASGIVRLKASELDVLETTTVGTGTLFLDALEKKHKHFVLALGGSCTNDMGIGIAHALGFRFLDKEKNELKPCGANLFNIFHISSPKTSLQIPLTILCDIDNPLYGENGAAYVFARQKGANDKIIEFLDKGMQHLSNIITNYSGKTISEIKGGGSAGGIAAGLYGLLPSVTIKSGFEFIADQTQLEEKINAADLVITGEGQLDHSSLQGKLIGHMITLCKHYNKPLIVVAGKNQLSKEEFTRAGIKAVFDVYSQASSKQDAIENATQYLQSLELNL